MSFTEPAIIEDRAIDEARPLRVVCIGAGISGILASIRIPQKLSNIHLRVYEKNSGIGGTWLENRYPGCSCGTLRGHFSICLLLSKTVINRMHHNIDIPAHTYQPTFEPNREWTQFYASAKEIHQYWEHVIGKYDCMRFIKLKHEVIRARWDSEHSEWQLKVRNPFCFEESTVARLSNNKIRYATWKLILLSKNLVMF